MSKRALLLVLAIVFCFSLPLSVWAAKNKEITVTLNREYDCRKAAAIFEEFIRDEDKEMKEAIESASEQELSELILQYDQKSSESILIGNAFGRLFYRSISLILQKKLLVISSEELSEEEWVDLNYELGEVLEALNEMEKRCLE